VLAGPNQSDRADPLFETGRGASERDWLQLDYLPGDRARVVFVHAGMGGLLGEPFQLPLNRRLVVEARCGSLLPPFDYPVFSGWTPDEFARARRDVQVKINGIERLRAVVDCYATSPSDLTVGHLNWPTGGVAMQFSGRVLSEERLPLIGRPAPLPRLTEPKPIAFSLLLPTQHNAGGDPILVTGRGSASDLLYGFFDGHGRIRFALDHYGFGGPRSEFVPYDPLRLHRLTVWMGSLAAAEPSVGVPESPTGSSEIPWSHRLVVSFDGRPMLNLEQVFYPGGPATARIGVNPFGSTTAGARFEGEVEQVNQVGFAVLPPLVATGAYGDVGLTLRFPSGVPGTREPLVVSGVTGAGDFLYVSYLDARHVAIGFDHWGTGGLIGRPIEIDYGQPHRVALSMGSLHPPGGSPDRDSLVRVSIDGRVALEGRSPGYPSTASQIRIGSNPIGGSTCGPTFTGTLISVVGGIERGP
jgi:hypothetical protein